MRMLGRGRWVLWHDDRLKIVLNNVLMLLWLTVILSSTIKRCGAVSGRRATIFRGYNIEPADGLRLTESETGTTG